MQQKLDLGTKPELLQVYKRAFAQAVQPDPRVSGQQLRAMILTAISPLRLDYEVHRLRGKAIEGETVK